MMIGENDALRAQLGLVNDGNRGLLETLNSRFGATLQELRSIQAEFTAALNSS